MKKNKKKLTFKEVYQLPLRADEYDMSYIWPANNVMTFNNVSMDNECLQLVLSILNGTCDKKSTKDVVYKDGYIKVDGKPILLLRGWGYLTGCGALNLPPKVAAKIQNDFANWVVNKLKGFEL